MDDADVVAKGNVREKEERSRAGGCITTGVLIEMRVCTR